ncbi:MAG: carboxypeptidase-like regulatory domain-containing protein [Flavobacteriales bacterium]|nr:carboxypeptidase-like regulatory domain-containing protein [Flavobacteriales bacterium]
MSGMRIVLTILAAFIQLMALSQGIVRGRVTDQEGETLIGANIVIKDEPGVGTVTDLDGAYSLRIERTGAITLVFSFIGAVPQEHVVTIANGNALVLNVEMKENSVQLGMVEVEAKAKRTGDGYLDKLKINAGASMDYISSDRMLRTGDSEASQAVRRVTGVSTVGSFITVRGLADRYIVTSINGSRIPTMDPLTNNLRLDLFPTGLLDNIVITKTATPDQPGDWSGAYVSLNTSDYPDRLRVSVSTTFGYNPNSSFKNVVIGARSSTDWLGQDDGLRAIPDGVPVDIEQFPNFKEPNLYEQLLLLGLGNYLNQYGIISSTPGFQGTSMATSGTIPHLSLTELGLLPPGQIYDANAVAAAVSTYNNTYDLAYFSPTVNGELAQLNTRFNNANWRVTDATGRPNFNQSISIGNQIQLFKKARTPKTLGFLLGLRYSTDTEYDGDATLGRTLERYNDTDPGSDFLRKGSQRISTESAGWNALGNFAFKLDRNNSFSVMVMPNVLGQNNARVLTFLAPPISGETFISEDQFYEERKLWVYQYGSRHLIPALNLKVETDASYSDGKRNVLDLKTLQYIKPADGGSIDNVDGALTPPGRIYRFLNETLLDARLSFALPLGDKEKLPRTIKFGGGYRRNERTNQQSYFTVLGAPGPSQWEQPGRFELGPDGRFTSRYSPFGTFKDNDIGISEVSAAYIMGDYAITERTRVIGGLRVEHTDLLTDILRFHELGLTANDTTRGTVGDLSAGGGGSAEPKPAIPGTIDQWDFLPSINVVHKLRKEPSGPMNLRLSYFRSLARPSFRELSVVQLFDYLLNAPVYGNPTLKMPSIDNFDIRLERFFANGNNITVSAFHKEFKNHIELLSTAAGGFTWRNADRSIVDGLELEGRIGILRGLEWRGNVTFMRSRSDLTSTATGTELKISTPMYGQAPYIVNSMLNYSLDSLGLVFSVSYNVQGPKLFVVNSELDPEGIQAYEMPRHQIDITATKNFGKHWGARFRVRNLLNAPIRRAYKFEEGYSFDFDKYRYGSEYALTISYTIR